MYVTRNIILLFNLYSAGLMATTIPVVNMPIFDIMHGLETEWVAKNMFYNGYPISIQEFTATHHADRIIKYYQSKWRISGHGNQNVQVVNNTHRLGYEKNGFSYSVQVKNTGSGSRGMLVIMKNQQYNLGIIVFPIHFDSKVISRLHSLDNSVMTETITLSSLRSIVLNKQWYHSVLINNDWVLQNSDTNLYDNVLNYYKDNQFCQITFANNTTKGNSLLMIKHVMRRAI